MNRSKLNIRTDLLRATKTALHVDQPFQKELVETFIEKAIWEFENNLPEEEDLKGELQGYKEKVSLVEDNFLERIRWGEKVLTISSRLGLQ